MKMNLRRATLRAVINIKKRKEKKKVRGLGKVCLFVVSYNRQHFVGHPFSGFSLFPKNSSVQIMFSR